MSTSFASDFLDEKPHVLTTKSLRISPQTSLKGLGILHDISLHTKDADLSLDFLVFEIPDFDIMIGHPLEKLFMGIPLLGKMDLKLGRNTVTNTHHSYQKLSDRISPLAHGSHVGCTF
jgi:hypothetical protein